MPYSTQGVVLTLQTLYWIPSSAYQEPDPPPEWFPPVLGPGVWPVFFTIDGTTASVSSDQANLGKLTGTAVAYGRTGVAEISALNQRSSALVPAAIGQWSGELVPIPAPEFLGGSVAAIAGLAVLALDVSEVVAGALDAGHLALNAAIEDALNQLITELPPFDTQVTQQEINDLTSQVESRVHDAIKNHLSLWEELTESVRWNASVVVHYSQDDLPPDALDQLDINAAAGAGTVGAVGFTGAVSQARRAVGQGQLSHFSAGIRAVTGFADDTGSAADDFQHVLVGTDDGLVTEIWWQGSGGPGQGTLSTFGSPIVALAGFYSPDGFRHGIAGTADRQVTELWWAGSSPAGRGTLYTFEHSVTALAAYHSGDGYENVIVATDDGAISQLWWQGGGAVGQGQLTAGNSRVVGLGGFYGTDNAHHVVVATADGNVVQLTWQGPAPATSIYIGQVATEDWSRPAAPVATMRPMTASSTRSSPCPMAWCANSTGQPRALAPSLTTTLAVWPD